MIVGNVFKSDTHSDDSQDHTNLPVVFEDLFSGTLVTELCSKYRVGIDYRLAVNQKKILLVSTKDKSLDIQTEYPAELISKHF